MFEQPNLVSAYNIRSVPFVADRKMFITALRHLWLILVLILRIVFHFLLVFALICERYR